MTLFTQALYIQTKAAHERVDKHPFMRTLYKTKSSQLYIEMNYAALRVIQEHSADFLNPPFFRDLYRNLESSFQVTNNELLNELMEMVNESCKKSELFLAQVYMWYLGLINGGNYIKKYIDVDEGIKDELFNFKNGVLLEDLLKVYMNSFKLESEELFIKNVNDTYRLIEQVLDKFQDE